MVSYISPITEEINRISADDHLINKVMDEGAEKARQSASKTIREARQIIGFRNR
jgi:tryptophanyl-tRNA synthetase